MATLLSLLDDTYEAAYWNGFLMADGSFSNVRLTCVLAEKDVVHLEKLRFFIGAPALRPVPQVNAVALSKQDRNMIPLIRSRFDIKDRKTYNPPSTLPYQDLKMLTSWAAGFIDGDGSFSLQSGRRSCFMRVVSHISWKPFLTELSDALNIGSVGVRNSRGVEYSHYTCYKHNDIVSFKRSVELLNIPTLDRKWGVIDSEYMARGGLKDQVVELIRLGMRNRDIVKIIPCSDSYISKLRKEITR